ncbi:MAG: T9SS type A sorting domain-containing protein [Bacteroidia bacterium]
MKKIKLLVFTFLVFLCSVFNAQVEMLKPLNGNAVLIQQKFLEKKNNAATQKHSGQQQQSLSTALFMPFFDDFSYNSTYPDPNKWDMSQSVYVNRGYAIAPPTIGAATFDGLNRGGYPYNIYSTSGSFISDTLLSKPIRLDYTDASLTVPVTPADSLYLSFYYQVKGRGDMPEGGDQLSLLFFTATDTLIPSDSLDFNTFPVWSKNGSSTPLQASDTNFHRVMIPIYRSEDDTIYFKHGLRFAFSNLGTRCGAIDHFHIDQVYLNKGRHWDDTLYPDVSFVYDGKSLLRSGSAGSYYYYSQMPYTQFSGSADMKDSISATLRNNNNKKTGGQWSGAVNITTEYQIVDNTGGNIKTQTCGTNNFFNYDSIGYCKDRALINPSLGGFTYNAGPFADTTSFLTKFYVKGNVNDPPENDTAFYRQKFSNYYAYDDGSAEAGYYVGAYGGEMAVKYKLNYKEKLRAIDIFFDPVFGVNTLQNTPIHLMVWGDNAGKPYNTIANDSFMVNTSDLIYPHYYNDGYNMFTRFELMQPIQLDSGQTFYVGTYQTFSVQLGVGFDLNNDNHKNIFYFDGSQWQNTSSAPMFRGSLMIHPVFGDSLMAVGVKSIVSEKPGIKIYPNPATDEITIAAPQKLRKILITDILGNVLYEELNPSQKVDVSSLVSGVYLIRMQTGKGEISSQKLIISR